MNQSAYLDNNLPIPERVQDLLSRLTLDEKVAMMNHPTQGVPRLGIPGYNFWSEALHGVARNGRATVFPQAIGMAATWDKDLIHQIATAIGDEGRAKYHEALRRNGRGQRHQPCLPLLQRVAQHGMARQQGFITPPRGAPQGTRRVLLGERIGQGGSGVVHRFSSRPQQRRACWPDPGIP